MTDVKCNCGYIGHSLSDIVEHMEFVDTLEDGQKHEFNVCISCDIDEDEKHG